MTTAQGVTRIVWQRLDVPGSEWCEVERTPDGTRISGVVTVPDDGRPYRVDYVLSLDPEGRTRQVEVDAVGPTESAVSVRLTADGKGSWRSGIGLVVESPAAIDADLGFSPITNSLPIWRLGLRAGETREIEVAWVLFPSLEVVHGRQSYERLGELTYVYRSSGFEAQIEVFADGLVREYRGLWRAVARSANP
jgi:hypothetical protein